MMSSKKNNSLSLGFVGIALFMFCFGFTRAQASPSFDTPSPSVYRQARNLGMGNVGVALKGTHASSPFYNPAGLNDLKKGKLRILNLTGEISQDAFSLINDVRDLVEDLEDASDENGDRFRVLDDFIAKNNGKFRHLRLTTEIVSYARKNFAIGLLAEENFDFTVREPAVPEFHVRSTTDLVAYVSGAKSFFDDALQVGVTLKPTVRLAMDEADEIIDYADTQDDANGKLKLESQLENIWEKQRFGLGADVGLKSNLAFGSLKEASWRKRLQPMVGVTWQDIGSPSFEEAPGNEESISVGMAIHPSFAKFENAFALDIRNINRDMPFISKLHVGWETKFPAILALRAGLSQGYASAGATVDLWVAKLSAAIYSEEIGVHTRQEGNTRYVVQLGFGM
ncbi:hypothetical protein MRY82_06365 [bacterium]|nr:hypothetical protein [bacterium]